MGNRSYKLKPGDTLVLDDLIDIGLSLSEIAENWRDIINSGADIRVVNCPELDTAKNKGITEIIIPALLNIAAAKQRLKSVKQREIIKQAKARGVKFGRKQRTLPENFSELKRRYLAGEISAVQGAKEANMPVTTFSKYTRME